MQVVAHGIREPEGNPASVFVGAWAALLAVSGLAAVAGRVLLRHLRLSVLHYASATVCFGLAAWSAWGLIQSW